MSYIQALVIQKDSNIFVNDDGTFGQLQLVPTPSSGGKVDSDYWASPIIGDGIVGTGFNYLATTAASTTKPETQSFHVVRIIVYNNQQATAWWVVGNSTQYMDASEQQEDFVSPPFMMPQTLAAFVPEQILCNVDDNGLYFGVLAAPTLGAGRYFAKGYLNGVALTALSGAGYASAATLLTALNASWSNVGTWTKSTDNLTFIVTQAAGSGEDVLSAAITVI